MPRLLLFCILLTHLGAQEVHWQDWAGQSGRGELRIAAGRWTLSGQELDPSQIFEVRLGAERGLAGPDQATLVTVEGWRLVGSLPAVPTFSSVALDKNGTILALSGETLLTIELRPLQSGALVGSAPAGPHVILRDGTIVPGEAEWLTGFDLGVRGPAGRMRLTRDRVHRIVTAKEARRGTGTTGETVVRTIQGDVVAGRIQTLDEEQLLLQLPGEMGTLRFVRDEVLTLTQRSDRVQSLCDLTPAATQTTPWLDFVRPPVIDGSLFGGALRLDGLPQVRGIAAHARTSLQWRLGGKWQRLLVAIGLDTTLTDRGEAVFVVRGDGRELARRSMRGGEATQVLELDIAEVDALELLLDFGPQGSGGSHGIWGEPRLVR